MIFRRKIYNQLLNWKKTSNGSTALLIEGARRIGKSTIFRFEIWTNKSISENEVPELKSFLSNKFGCSATVKKIRTN